MKHQAWISILAVTLALLVLPLLAHSASADSGAANATLLDERIIGAASPGHRYDFALRAQANRQNIRSSFCPAALQIGHITVGIDFSSGIWDYGAYLVIADADTGRVLQREHIGDVGPGSNRVFQATVTIEAHCDGTVIVEASTPGHEVRTSFGMGNEAPRLVAIEYHEGGGLITAGCTSSVDLQRNIVIEQCSNTTIPNYYGEPSTGHHLLDSIADALGSAGRAFLVVLLIGFAGLILLISYRQAKKHKLLVLVPLVLLFLPILC